MIKEESNISNIENATEQPCQERRIRKHYRNPTEDRAIGNVMREWRRDQRRLEYERRKAIWEAQHPGKVYENRKRFNTRVWREGER